MLKYLKAKGIKVNGIIDNDNDKIGTIINDVSIISLSEVMEDKINVFISISSEKIVEDIMKQINCKQLDLNVVTFNDIYGKSDFPELSWY